MERQWKEIGHLDFVSPTKKSIKIVAEFSLTCYRNMAESYISW